MTTTATVPDAAVEHARVSRYQVRIERDQHPTMRIVIVDGCPHRVSLADGQDTPAGNFLGFAKMEHHLFCRSLPGRDHSRREAL
jgi:D-aminopeptidase